jgi:polysaccharide biosynthesis transport protein
MDERVSHDIWKDPSWPEDTGWSTPAAVPGPKFGFDDVCYVLFRHKWKILFFSLLGLAAAVALYYNSPRLYRSEARLMVKYIPEMEPPTAGYGEGPIRSPLLRGESVVNSEMEILTSMDLALKVAEAVGPQRILARVGGGDDVVSAALVVNSGTICDAPRRGNVIRVMFQHPDPTLVQPVLSNLMQQYVVKHSEIHLALASLDDFAQQREQIQERLHKTEQHLWDLKRTNGVFSVEESKKAAAEQVFRIQQTLSDAETELEARRAALKAMQEGAPQPALDTTSKSREERRERYQSILSQLEQLRHQRSQLMGQFLESSSMVQPVRQSIEELETQKRALEKEDPDLLFAAASSTANGGTGAFDETGRITVLNAKVEALKSSLARARHEEEKLYEVEAPIVRLQRTKDLEEGKFRYLSSALEQAQIDSSLGSSRLSNISRVEDPTPPTRDIGPLYKRVAALAGGGMALGIGLALLMEFFVDQTVKRSREVPRLVRAPLYMSIPRIKGRLRRMIPPPGAAPGSEGRTAVSTWSPNKAERRLMPFVEALRDRVLNRFESLARKPKLVGVCGATPGCGVTSIAAGLASSLSEAGDLKVLLVDMKRGTGRPHPILGARKSCSLMEVLEGPKRQEALIAPNLYLAQENGASSQPVVTSPRKFTTVVPQLNTSDYDYIVFDMPPVDPVSITPRLSKHMDLTLLVVEAEKAHQNTVREAGSLLLEFSQNLAVVLNKTRNYLPGQVGQSA